MDNGSSLKSVQNFIEVGWCKMTPKPEIGLKEFNIYDAVIIALCGSFKSNGGKNYTARNKDRNDYLSGVKCDMTNIKKFQLRKYFQVFSLENPGATCSLAYEHIVSAIKANPNSGIHIYYTGHGCRDDGSWCFSDGTISAKELRNYLNSRGITKRIPFIMSDSCYSGKFCKESVICGLSEVAHASSYLEKTSGDSSSGGLYTRWLFGEINCPIDQSPESYRVDPDGKYQWLSRTMNAPWK